MKLDTLKMLDPSEEKPIEIICKINSKVYKCIGLTKKLIKCEEKQILVKCISYYEPFVATDDVIKG